MHRYKILHRTYYNFSGPVTLQPHTLRLRPREGHELRIESSVLNITPAAKIRWRRDVEDNSIATATFSTSASRLTIESEVIIQQFNEAPLDFLVADHAVNYPFAYEPDDLTVLEAYMHPTGYQASAELRRWMADVYEPGEALQTYELLQRLAAHIHERLAYQKREEPGVQTADDTLARGSGSCRDFANLFIVVARTLGLAARFVSGYLHVTPTPVDSGATHAWAEVFLPGAGWKGFDPTIGKMAGPDHITVAVARRPESVPPVEGSFIGMPGANLSVGVWVTDLQ